MSRRLRIVFMGSPEFACPALQALSNIAFADVIAVYSQPPRPKQRGMHEQPTPVHALAQNLGIPVFCPVTLRNAEEQEKLAALQPDVIIVVAYGLILPQAVLDIPPHGCINIHASLLPRWRGAAPIQRAVEAGDAQTGITIMKMEAGLDTGPMYAAAGLPIHEETLLSRIHDDLAQLGARLLVQTLPGIIKGEISPAPQDENAVTYAHKLSRDESLLDPALPAQILARKVRAFTPWPGTHIIRDNTDIKVLAAEVAEQPEGTHYQTGSWAEPLAVACADGKLLRLLRVQIPGGKPMSSAEFINGYLRKRP